MIKVSIIVPVYNTEAYLKRCLNSLIKQTLENIEIICINDGSTDTSLEILQEYQKKDKRIKVFTQSNQGLSVSRNNGMDKAVGEYIGFVDSDDWVDEKFYEQLYKYANEKNADICIAKTTLISDKGILMEYSNQGISTNFCDSIQKLHNGSVWDKIFKRKFCTNNKLSFPKGLFFEDNVFLIKALYFSKITFFTDTVSYYYFQNPQGICRNCSKKNLQKKEKDTKIIKNVLIKIAKDFSFSKQERKFLKQFIKASLTPNQKRSYLKFFYQKKVTKSGKLIIKICKIPIYSQRIKKN